MSTSTESARLGPPLVLEARGLTAGYGPQPVIHQLDLHVAAGEVVVLLGANGVGKTTTMLALTGELPPIAGEVHFDGSPIRSALHRRARLGLGYVPEGRSLFFGLTVRENLTLARAAVSDALALFPELEKRLDVRGGLLSGGEQQMLALARTLSRKPRLMLVDELSLGLGPMVVARLLTALRAAAEDGTGVLFVEQNARKALRYADRAYVMRRGRLVLEGPAASLQERIGEIEDEYLAQRTGDATAPTSISEPARPATGGKENGARPIRTP